MLEAGDRLCGENIQQRVGLATIIRFCPLPVELAVAHRGTSPIVSLAVNH